MLQRASLWMLTGTVFVVGIGWTLHASARQKPPENQKPKTKNQKPTAQKTAHLEFEKDWTYDAKTGLSTGRNFTYKEDEMTITGITARYFEKEKRLYAEGDLKMDDPQYHGTGDKADVDNSPKKLAIITGNIKIVLKPKKDENAKPDENEDAGKVRRRGGTVTCDRIESYYKKKFSTLSGNLVFKQIFMKDGREVERTLTAHHADYDSKADKMTLYPPVKGSDTDGQMMEAEGIVFVGTKEGEETLNSKDKIILTIKRDEEEDDDGTKPPPTTDGKR